MEADFSLLKLPSSVLIVVGCFRIIIGKRIWISHSERLLRPTKSNLCMCWSMICLKSITTLNSYKLTPSLFYVYQEKSFEMTPVTHQPGKRGKSNTSPRLKNLISKSYFSISRFLFIIPGVHSSCTTLAPWIHE